MTHVTLRRTPDGAIFGFCCVGHAEYARSGHDIVCAALSALATTCANALESVAGLSPEVVSSDGNLTVQVKEADLTRDAQVIFLSFAQGMRDLQEAYPKHIRLTDG